VQSDVDGDMSVIDGGVQTMQDTLASMLLDMANLRDELISMIKQAAASDNIMVWSVYGQQVALQRALDDMYDADRTHGLFVSDFDNLALSPEQFDALNVSPRVFDLHSTNKVNTVSGDITRDDILWLSNEPLVPPNMQELSKVFLTINPTASQFSRGN
jgi:hypothetical protein